MSSCRCLNADDCNHELDHQSPSDLGEDFVDLFSGVLIAVGMDLAHGLSEGFAAYVRIASIRQKFERKFVHRVDLIPYRDEIDLEDEEQVLGRRWAVRDLEPLMVTVVHHDSDHGRREFGNVDLAEVLFVVLQPSVRQCKARGPFIRWTHLC
jgi:hypothetical protein